jgi:hypothetical protein
MKLSETTEGRVWIRQFDYGDQADAAFLLDSLRLVSADRFHGEIRRAVTRTAENFGDNIALYAVREVDGDEVYFVQEGKRPPSVQPGQSVGSEGTMAHIITTLSRSNRQRFLNHPPLRTLKTKQSRHIFLLDDLVGSGNRVMEFLNSWRRNKTIVSWCSNHYISFHLVAYSISEEAESFIRGRFGKRKGTSPVINISFSYAKRPAAIGGRWTDADRQRLITLCEKYGKRGKIKWADHLGYRKSMSVMVFSHGCPNNVPGIVWAATGSWSGIFPNRVVPESLFSQMFSREALFASVSKPDQSPPVIEEDEETHSVLFHLLLLVRSRVRGIARLAEILDLTTYECTDLLTLCRRLKLIDANGALTDFGRAELHRVEREDKLKTERTAQSRPFYVPKQLRKTRGSV